MKKMKNIQNLLKKIAAQESQLTETQFMAPCVGGGRVRTRVAGMVYTFATKPGDFQGWGIFQPLDEKTAEVVEEPMLFQIEEYLELMKPLRMFLVDRLQKQTWLAYPVNESDAKQRLGMAKPAAVHLVSDGMQFEQIIARFDGSSFWFEDSDRRADPLAAEELRKALKKVVPPEELRFKGMTPEMRTVYDLVARKKIEFMKQMEQQRDEKRLKKALEMGGGELRSFRDRAEYWQVEWVTRDGQNHSSAIAKNDLTVISSGICLSGLDRNFDLQSLVGVMEDA
jgi:hypothetical protein